MLGLCVNILHRHPRELAGTLDIGDLREIMALRVLEEEERPKRRRE